jgi:hypothetical protein
MASNPAAKIARFKRKLESPEEKPNKKQKTGEKKEKESPPKEKKESKKSSNKAKDKRAVLKKQKVCTLSCQKMTILWIQYCVPNLSKLQQRLPNK